MRWVFSGDVSDEARRNIQSSEIEFAKSEAVTQESLGRSPRKSDPKKSIALKARFNPAGETPYGSRLVTRFQRQNVTYFSS
jgi:hypothetical protein